MTLDVSGATEDGAALLDAVDEFMAKYVIYPSEHARHSHVLWCAHTYLMDCFDSTPRLYSSRQSREAARPGHWR